MVVKHQVAVDDSLVRLAGRYYGDTSLYSVIAIANNLANPA